MPREGSAEIKGCSKSAVVAPGGGLLTAEMTRSTTVSDLRHPAAAIRKREILMVGSLHRDCVSRQEATAGVGSDTTFLASL